ncbi:MAG: NBR1-Ig-like domain-containing protein, partial [Anaerolineales bacterium]|nr:NBR1-Ig-like domain-containing protein [Anaerolineales bacterium]
SKTPTQEPTVEEASPTPPPTFTPVPSATAIPCDRADFITDVTVPDGSDYSPGDVFTKTWRLKNTGSCTWTSGYDLVFDHGDQMGAPAAVQLTSSTVGTNQTVDVSVQLTAPGSEGNYKGYFKLRNSQGAIFGIGATGSVAFWVEIEVLGPPEPNFTVSFVNVGLCNPIYATFKVKNTGDYAFEWARIYIQDLTASTTLYGPANNPTPFVASSSDCPPGASAMDPGQTRYIAASLGSPVPSGHNARLTLRLCTIDGGGGLCVEKTTDFTVP